MSIVKQNIFLTFMLLQENVHLFSNCHVPSHKLSTFNKLCYIKDPCFEIALHQDVIWSK